MKWVETRLSRCLYVYIRRDFIEFFRYSAPSFPLHSPPVNSIISISSLLLPLTPFSLHIVSPFLQGMTNSYLNNVWSQFFITCDTSWLSIPYRLLGKVIGGTAAVAATKAMAFSTPSMLLLNETFEELSQWGIVKRGTSGTVELVDQKQFASRWGKEGSTLRTANVVLFNLTCCQHVKWNQGRSRYCSQIELAPISSVFPNGHESWIGFSNFVPATWQGSTGAQGDLLHIFKIDGGSSMQSKRNRSNYYPPIFSLSLIGARFQATVCGTAPANGKTEASSICRYFSLGRFEKGVWSDWVVHSKLAVDASLGFLHVYRGEVLMLSIDDISTAYDDEATPFVQLGIEQPYWATGGSSSYSWFSIGYSALRLGPAQASYAEVYTGDGTPCGEYCFVERFEQNECTSSYIPMTRDWIKRGGFILLIVVMLQCFWGLAIVCDHYFCSSLMVMCEDKGIPDNVAGATVMAIGTSAADLMISLVSLLVSRSTLGLGTIIGSEIFNHLVISAACVMNAKNQELKLQASVLTREIVAYGLTLLLLMWAVKGGSFSPARYSLCLTVNWYHGLVLMLAYCVYAMVVVYYDKLLSFLPEEKNEIEVDTYVNCSTIDGSRHPEDADTQLSASAITPQQGDMIYAEDDTIAEQILKSPPCSISLSSQSETSANPLHSIPALEVDKDEALHSSVNSRLDLFVSRVNLPLRLAITYTIPDVTIAANRHLYPLTALLAIVWLGILAEIMLESVNTLGDLVGVSPVLMGMTVGAWGASMPTLWSSVVVARRGLGDMAISNALGANVFSVLVGLGLPWLIYPLVTHTPYSGIQDSGILPLLLLLLLLSMAYYLLLRTYNFIMYAWMGYIFLLAYTITIVLCLTVFVPE